MPACDRGTKGCGFLAGYFCVWSGLIGFAYREGVGITPAQSVDGAVGKEDPGQCGANGGALDGTLLDELWIECGGESYGLERSEFDRILFQIGQAQDLAEDEGGAVSRQQLATYFRDLKLGDLVLARACAAGNERAWERFVALYRQPLVRAAIAITGSETLGRELAEQLYGELFGLTMRDGERRCPLESYRGRGSLIGWLRTTLAQRHVDHYRRRHREQQLEELDAPAPEFEAEKTAIELSVLEKAVEGALKSCGAEDRLLLAAYFLDGRTLLQIAGVLNVHEATVSRKLKRGCEGIRKQVVKNLQSGGMSRRAAEEALGADPRDLDLNLKKLLQYSQVDAFEEKAAR
jgi:RNA polymerase sigma-70 factor, ECF subfamily